MKAPESKRTIDDRTYLSYLFPSIGVPELKYICKQFTIKGFSRLKKKELIEFILDSLAEEEMKEVIEQKELEIVTKGIDTAIEKIKGIGKENIGKIKIVNGDQHEIEISFSGMDWEIVSSLTINSENIGDPERDCDCQIGSVGGFCNHFWVGFIVSLKKGFFKLSDWTLTKLPEDFEESIKFENLKSK